MDKLNTIFLDQQEQELLAELNITELGLQQLQNTEQELSNDIKSKAIEAIVTAFGLSGLGEGRVYNTVSEYNKSYLGERSSKDLSQEKYGDFKDFADKHTYHRGNMEGGEFRSNVKKIREENQEYIESGYENKTFLHGEKYEYDHLISLNEVSSNKAHMYFIGDKEISEIFNEKDFNVFAISKDLNREKGSMRLEDFKVYLDETSKYDPTKTNAEYHNINKEKITSKIQNVIKKKADLDNRLIFKTTKESLDIAGKNALKGGAKIVFGQVLVISINEIIDGYNSNEELSIKQRIQRIIEKIKYKSKDLLASFKEFSLTSFLSIFVEGIITSIFKTIKNAYKFIKTILLSIVKSVKVLFDMKITKEDRKTQVLNILKNTFKVMIGFALFEAIKTILIQVPFLNSFSGVLSEVISALIVGIGGVLLVRYFNSNKNNLELKSLKEKNLSLTKQVACIKEIKVEQEMLYSFKLLQGADILCDQLMSNFIENQKEIAENNEYFNATLNETRFLLQESKKSGDSDDIWELLSKY